MKWESPEINKLAKVRDYGSSKVLLFSILNFWLFLIFFGFINAENFRSNILNFLGETWFPIVGSLVMFFGNFFAFGFLIVGVYSFYRYCSTPPPLSLTNKQRALLGLPTLFEDNSQQSQKISPPSPLFTSGSSTGTLSVGRSSSSLPVSSLSVVSSPHHSPVSVFSSPTSNSDYYSPYSSFSSNSGTPLGSPHNVIRERKQSPAIGTQYPQMQRKFPSLPLSEYAITNERDLEKYLKAEEEKETLQKLLGLTSSPSENMSVTEGSAQSTSIPLQTYRPSYRPTSETPNKKLTDEELYYVTNNAARELYHRLGIDSHIGRWTEKMRMWIATKILQPLVLWIEMIEHQTGVPLWEQQLATVGQIFQVTTGGLWTTAPNPMSSVPGSVQEQLMKERMRLEKYLNLMGCASREYLVKRIKALASGSYISAFVWDGGGEWKNQKWTTELPTDSQIIIHLFCTYMDELLSNDNSMFSQDLFTRYHYVRYPANPDKVHSNAKIYQSQIHPPHFNVIVGKETWHILRGRNNLFQALVLFLWYIKENWKGFLHQTYLGTPSIGLLSIFDNDDDDEQEE